MGHAGKSDGLEEEVGLGGAMTPWGYMEQLLGGGDGAVAGEQLSPRPAGMS